jgi:hypothetical protein
VGMFTEHTIVVDAGIYFGKKDFDREYK